MLQLSLSRYGHSPAQAQAAAARAAAVPEFVGSSNQNQSLNSFRAVHFVDGEK